MKLLTMKRVIIFAAIFAFVLSSQCLLAQVVNVPNKSEKLLAEKYPEAKNVNWSNNVKNYTAKFTINDEKYKAYYNIDGSWDFTEMEMDYSKFPEEVVTSFKNSRFSDWKMLSTAYVENNKDEKMYRVEIKKGLEKKYIFFDSNGKEMKTNATL
jgi:hypothetical protein